MPPASSSSSRVKPLSILVADDDAGILGLMELCLAKAGHSVTCVSSSGEIFPLIANRQFDLIVTDMFMPDSDGFDLVGRLRKADATLRILVVSGGGEQFDPSDCLKTAKIIGAHAALGKPFTQPGLFEAVSRAMSA